MIEDSKTDGLTANIVDFDRSGKHTTFIIEVVNASNSPWEIHTRYKRLREMHLNLKKINDEKLPKFPPRMIFLNRHKGFLKKRKNGLQSYFDQILSKPNYYNIHPMVSILYGEDTDDIMSLAGN